MPRRAVGIDAPRQLDPELVLLPHLADARRLVRLPRPLELAALPPQHLAQHRLAEADPARGVRFLRHEVVALGCVAHRQDVVGEPGRLAPDRREAGVALHHGLVHQHLHPRQPVGIGPHRVVDAGEVHGELAAALLQEVRQEERHLEERQRVLARHQQLAPHAPRRGHHGRRGHGLVEGAGRGAAGRRHRAHEHDEELQRAGHLPAAQVARRGIAPDVRGERRARPGDLARDLDDGGGGDAALALGELRRIGRVELLERALEALVGAGKIGPLLAQVLLPVDPAAHEVAVVAALEHEQARDREEQRRFRARPWRQPPVGHRRRVGQARVDHADLGALHLALDDPLRVRVEVVPALEVGGQEQHEARVGVIRGRPVEPHPERVARAGARRADVRVAIVPVDAPGVKHALQVDQLVPRPAQVIHDLLRPAVDQRAPDAARDVVERLVPRHALPLAAAARPLAPQRIADALRVVHLVERGRALGAVPPAAAGMHGIALELLDAARGLVDVGEEPARGFTIEADRRDQGEAPLDLLRPGRRVVGLPVVPSLDRRIRGERASGRGEAARDGMKGFGHRAHGHLMTGGSIG